jgi:HK97 family phage portal protein
LPPQGLAELRPIIPTGYYYAEQVGMELEYKFALYGEIYQRQPWVHAVVNKRAESIARLPVNVWDIKGNTKELDTRSAYARLIADPCPYLDPFSFWGWIQRTIDIYGETYLAMHKDANGSPIALMPMHPSRVTIRREADTGEYTYYFQAGSGVNTELVAFKQDEVVPFKLFNPNKLERGFSKMEAIRSTIFAEDASRTATSAMWKNAARPNMVLSTDSRLGRQGRERLKLAFDQAHAGSSNAGQTLVLEDGVTATAMQISVMDMQYIESRQMNREEVCGVYDVAPPIVHILDRATFSNIAAQMRSFYRDTMAPVIQFMQSVMDKYVGSYWLRSNIIRFAVEEVIRGDFEIRMEAAHKALSTGVMTPNEARDMVGLNRYDDPKADKLYANSAIQELGMPAEMLRMTETAEGTTPDGIRLGQAPPTTPVPSARPTGQKPGRPHSIPALPMADAQHNPSGPQPGNADPSSKYVRSIKGAVGRGKTEEEIYHMAMDLAQNATNEHELDAILRAVEIAYADKDN